MNRDDAPSTFSQAWAQLTGYVTEARDDGDGLDPAQLLSYMTELRGEVLATALTEAFPPAPVGGQAEPSDGPPSWDQVMERVGQRRLLRAIELSVDCTCPPGPLPATYDGPEPACAVHPEETR